MCTFPGQRKETTQIMVHVTCIQALEVYNSCYKLVFRLPERMSCNHFITTNIGFMPTASCQTLVPSIKHGTASGVRESNWNAQLKVWTFGKPRDTKSSGCVKCQQHLIWPLSSEGYVKNELQMHTVLNKRFSFCIRISEC